MAVIKVTKTTFGGQNVVCDGYTKLPMGFSDLVMEYEWDAPICPGDLFQAPVYIRIWRSIEGDGMTFKDFEDSIGCWGQESFGEIKITGLAVHEGVSGYLVYVSTDPTYANPQNEQYQCKWTNDVNYNPILPLPGPIIPPLPGPIGPIPTEEKGNNMGLIIGGVVGALFLLFLVTRRKKKV